MTSVLA